MLAIKSIQNNDAHGRLTGLCYENTIVTVPQNGVAQVYQVAAALPVVSRGSGEFLVFRRKATLYIDHQTRG
ncbi:hypothetical protein [Mycobacterium leprae]|uniref:hypothetical protein n=1 Tax=Mycobacterium leprae TaxID=1769 RepID=UPI0034D2B5A8